MKPKKLPRIPRTNETTKITPTHLLKLDEVTPQHIFEKMQRLHRHKSANKRGLLKVPTHDLANAIYEIVQTLKAELSGILQAHSNIRLLPLHGILGDQCTCNVANCHSPGKHPRISHWQNFGGGSSDVYQLAKWIYQFGLTVHMNIGVKTGLLAKGSTRWEENSQTGKRYHVAEDFTYLCILDIDTPDLTDQRKILEMFGQRTFLVKTQSGGLHAYYLSEKVIPSTVKSIDGHADIRCRGALVVAPGSMGVHGQYEVDTDNDWFSEHIALLSPAVVKALRDPHGGSAGASSKVPTVSKRATGSSEISSLTTDQLQFKQMAPHVLCEMFERGESFVIPMGVRNDVAFKMGGYLRGCRSYSPQELADYLRRLRDQHFEDFASYSDDEIESIASWYATKPPNSAQSPARYCRTRRDFIKRGDAEAFFSVLTLSSAYETPLEAVASSYQRHLQDLGYSFQKSINKSAVSGILIDRRFSRRKIRQGDRTLSLWNIDPSSIPLYPLSFSIDGTGAQAFSSPHLLSMGGAEAQTNPSRKPLPGDPKLLLHCTRDNIRALLEPSRTAGYTAEQLVKLLRLKNSPTSLAMILTKTGFRRSKRIGGVGRWFVQPTVGSAELQPSTDVEETGGCAGAPVEPPGPLACGLSAKTSGYDLPVEIVDLPAIMLYRATG